MASRTDRAKVSWLDKRGRVVERAAKRAELISPFSLNLGPFPTFRFETLYARGTRIHDNAAVVECHQSAPKDLIVRTLGTPSTCSSLLAILLEATSVPNLLRQLR